MGVPSLAKVAGDPVAWTQWTSTFVCEDLSMGSADEGDQRVGDQLVTKAGGVAPLEGLVMAQQADRSIVFGLHFETSDQASRNLQPRVDLASGDAPGQGGLVAERFTLASGTADGQDVVLTTKPTKPHASGALRPHLRTRPLRHLLTGVRYLLQVSEAGFPAERHGLPGLGGAG